MKRYVLSDTLIGWNSNNSEVDKTPPPSKFQISLKAGRIELHSFSTPVDHEEIGYLFDSWKDSVYCQHVCKTKDILVYLKCRADHKNSESMSLCAKCHENRMSGLIDSKHSIGKILTRQEIANEWKILLSENDLKEFKDASLSTDEYNEKLKNHFRGEGYEFTENYERQVFNRSFPKRLDELNLTEPAVHQKIPLLFIDSASPFRNQLLYAQVGSGKTATILMIMAKLKIQALRDKKDIKLVFVTAEHLVESVQKDRWAYKYVANAYQQQNKEIQLSFYDDIMIITYTQLVKKWLLKGQTPSIKDGSVVFASNDLRLAFTYAPKNVAAFGEEHNNILPPKNQYDPFENTYLAIDEFQYFYESNISAVRGLKRSHLFVLKKAIFNSREIAKLKQKYNSEVILTLSSATPLSIEPRETFGILSMLVDTNLSFDEKEIKRDITRDRDAISNAYQVKKLNLNLGSVDLSNQANFSLWSKKLLQETEASARLEIMKRFGNNTVSLEEQIKNGNFLKILGEDDKPTAKKLTPQEKRPFYVWLTTKLFLLNLEKQLSPKTAEKIQDNLQLISLFRKKLPDAKQREKIKLEKEIKTLEAKNEDLSAENLAVAVDINTFLYSMYSKQLYPKPWSKNAIDALLNPTVRKDVINGLKKAASTFFAKLVEILPYDDENEKASTKEKMMYTQKSRETLLNAWEKQNKNGFASKLRGHVTFVDLNNDYDHFSYILKELVSVLLTKEQAEKIESFFPPKAQPADSRKKKTQKGEEGEEEEEEEDDGKKAKDGVIPAQVLRLMKTYAKDKDKEYYDPDKKFDVLIEITKKIKEKMKIEKTARREAIKDLKAEQKMQQENLNENMEELQSQVASSEKLNEEIDEPGLSDSQKKQLNAKIKKLEKTMSALNSDIKQLQKDVIIIGDQIKNKREEVKRFDARTQMSYFVDIVTFKGKKGDNQLLAGIKLSKEEENALDLGFVKYNSLLEDATKNYKRELRTKFVANIQNIESFYNPSRPSDSLPRNLRFGYYRYSNEKYQFTFERQAVKESIKFSPFVERLHEILKVSIANNKKRRILIHSSVESNFGSNWIASTLFAKGYGWIPVIPDKTEKPEISKKNKKIELRFKRGKVQYADGVNPDPEKTFMFLSKNVYSYIEEVDDEIKLITDQYIRQKRPKPELTFSDVVTQYKFQSKNDFVESEIFSKVVKAWETRTRDKSDPKKEYLPSLITWYAENIYGNILLVWIKSYTNEKGENRYKLNFRINSGTLNKPPKISFYQMWRRAINALDREKRKNLAFNPNIENETFANSENLTMHKFWQKYLQDETKDNKENKENAIFDSIEKARSIGKDVIQWLLKAGFIHWQPSYSYKENLNREKAISDIFNDDENFKGDKCKILLLDSDYYTGIDVFNTPDFYQLGNSLTSAYETQRNGRFNRYGRNYLMESERMSIPLKGVVAIPIKVHSFRADLSASRNANKIAKIEENVDEPITKGTINAKEKRKATEELTKTLEPLKYSLPLELIDESSTITREYPEILRELTESSRVVVINKTIQDFLKDSSISKAFYDENEYNKPTRKNTGFLFNGVSLYRNYSKYPSELFYEKTANIGSGEIIFQQTVESLKAEFNAGRLTFTKEKEEIPDIDKDYIEQKFLKFVFGELVYLSDELSGIASDFKTMKSISVASLIDTLDIYACDLITTEQYTREAETVFFSYDKNAFLFVVFYWMKSLQKNVETRETLSLYFKRLWEEEFLKVLRSSQDLLKKPEKVPSMPKKKQKTDKAKNDQTKLNDDQYTDLIYYVFDRLVDTRFNIWKEFTKSEVVENFEKEVVDSAMKKYNAKKKGAKPTVELFRKLMKEKTFSEFFNVGHKITIGNFLITTKIFYRKINAFNLFVANADEIPDTGDKITKIYKKTLFELFKDNKEKLLLRSDVEKKPKFLEKKGAVLFPVGQFKAQLQLVTNEEAKLSEDFGLMIQSLHFLLVLYEGTFDSASKKAGKRDEEVRQLSQMISEDLQLTWFNRNVTFYTRSLYSKYSEAIKVEGLVLLMYLKSNETFQKEFIEFLKKDFETGGGIYSSSSEKKKAKPESKKTPITNADENSSEEEEKLDKKKKSEPLEVVKLSEVIEITNDDKDRETSFDKILLIVSDDDDDEVVDENEKELERKKSEREQIEREKLLEKEKLQEEKELERKKSEREQLEKEKKMLEKEKLQEEREEKKEEKKKKKEKKQKKKKKEEKDEKERAFKLEMAKLEAQKQKMQLEMAKVEAQKQEQYLKGLELKIKEQELERQAQQELSKKKEDKKEDKKENKKKDNDDDDNFA